MKLVYLTAPYCTPPDPPDVRQKYIDQATAGLIANHEDVYFFSPITYEKPVKDIWGENGEWDFWKPRDGEMVKRCDELWVLMLENWQASRGVNYEIGEALKAGKVVRHITFEMALYCRNMYRVPS
jgi:hypothetical protein